MDWNTPCFIRFIVEESKKNYEVSVQCQDPSGVIATLFINDVEVSPGPGGGAMLVNNLTIHMKQPGRYWLDLLIDGTVLARQPLDVAFKHVSA